MLLVRRGHGNTLLLLQSRQALDISQEELAERAELHRTYISSIEQGDRNISLENIEKVARALDISIAALFTQYEIEKP